jgi:ribonuclease-3
MNSEQKLKWSDYIYKKQNESKMFKIAFTHPSYKIQGSSVETNDNLELIGDKVLDLVLYQNLYKKYENTISKHQMDNLRQRLMSKTGLAYLFDVLNLEPFVNKPPKYDLTFNPTVKHNIVESLIGATYLEEGYELAYKFIIELVKIEI